MKFPAFKHPQASLASLHSRRKLCSLSRLAGVASTPHLSHISVHGYQLETQATSTPQTNLHAGAMSRSIET